MTTGDTHTVWFDESGFTGEDLINAEQRHFALTSSVVGDEEALDILQACFPRYAGGEFKSSTLWRGQRHRAGLLRFAERLDALGDRTYTYVIDKRFSLLIKLVDYLIEPTVWRSGGDFYRDAYSRKFVNGLHADLLLHGGQALYDETISVWNTLARSPTDASLTALRRFLAAKASGLQPPLSSFFDLARRGADIFVDPGERIEDFRSSNEIQVTAVHSLVGHWGTLLPGRLLLVHDESTSFFQQKSMWDALVRDDVEPFVAEAAGGSVAFPLPVAGTRSERSERSAAIQLCDVVAGMFGKALRIFAGDRDPFLIDLMRAGLGDAPFDGVMPQPERADGPFPQRGGPDIVDRMAEVLAPALADIRREREHR